MKKPKLPERLYYPIPEAAEYLGCTVRDVYHYCATGMLTLNVYIQNVESKDVGYMSLDLGSSNLSEERIRNRANLDFLIAYIHGIHYEKEAPDYGFVLADYLEGFFTVYANDCHLLELSNESTIELTGLETPPSGAGEDGVSIFFDKPLIVSRDSLCILTGNIKEIMQIDELSVSKTSEHPRTSNRKGEIIPALLKMIPEFNGVDIYKEKACKISDILEATAASKGIELQMPDKNTWARYLGREVGKK